MAKKTPVRFIQVELTDKVKTELSELIDAMEHGEISRLMSAFDQGGFSINTGLYKGHAQATAVMREVNEHGKRLAVSAGGATILIALLALQAKVFWTCDGELADVEIEVPEGDFLFD